MSYILIHQREILRTFLAHTRGHVDVRDYVLHQAKTHVDVIVRAAIESDCIGRLNLTVAAMEYLHLNSQRAGFIISHA